MSEILEVVIHHDPFNRMLLAQAKIDKLTFLTGDKLLKKYKIAMVINSEKS